MRKNKTSENNDTTDYGLLGLRHRRPLILMLILSWLLALYVIRGYLILIISAAILALLFNPVHNFFRRKVKKSSTSATLTFIVALVIVIIPTFIFIVIAVNQAQNLIDGASSYFSQYRSVNDFSSKIVTNLNNALSTYGSSLRISTESFQNFVNSTLNAAANWFIDSAKNFTGGIFSFFSKAITFIIVFIGILNYKDQLLKTVRTLSPLGPEITQSYLDRVGLMTKGMVQGQLLIAISQGLADAILIYIAGLHSGFFFIALLLTVLSVIPLGGGILAIPIGIWMLLTGNIIGGIVIIAGHFLIVTNIDNVLRPLLVPKKVRMPSALTLVSVFAGISVFGFIGFILGPVVMIIAVTTTQLAMATVEKYQTHTNDNKQST